jgi:hypothetical protein
MRAETFVCAGDGKEWSLQVRPVEGASTPKPRAVIRKGDSEASVGERVAQPLSLTRISVPKVARVRHRGAAPKGGG